MKIELVNLLFATNRAIASALPAGEESPDSKEHCTGEEPGSDPELVEGKETESATENNYHATVWKR